LLLLEEKNRQPTFSKKESIKSAEHKACKTNLLTGGINFESLFLTDKHKSVLFTDEGED
jgi:hypothetical protein